MVYLSLVVIRVGEFMNWKEFKDKVEAAGVTDDMKLWYIDVACDLDINRISIDETLGFSVW